MAAVHAANERCVVSISRWSEQKKNTIYFSFSWKIICYYLSLSQSNKSLLFLIAIISLINMMQLLIVYCALVFSDLLNQFITTTYPKVILH